MKSHLGIFLSSLWIINALNTTDFTNKTKRNPTGIQNYGDPNIVWMYSDNLKSQTAPRAIETFYTNAKPLTFLGVQTPVKAYEPKVAAQQVLYEFQQTPTNAVSNVHVKQLFQPVNNFNHEINPEYKPQTHSGPPSIVNSETVVAPVQHSQIIQHNVHPYTNVRTHPLYNVQPQYHAPRKYIYVNGKIIYDPNSPQVQPHATPNFFHSSQQFHQTPQYFQRPVINYVNQHPPRPNLVPPSPPPAIYSKFQPPAKSQLQPVDTPSHPPPEKERQHKHEEEEKEERPISENEDNRDENEEQSENQENESDNYDESPIFGKYSFDEDEDHHEYREHEDAEEDDDDVEDNKRGSTRYTSSKVKKYPKKTHKPVMKSEVYYGSKYEYPEVGHPKKNGKKHKMHFKSYKYSKNTKGNPKHEGIEGRHSEHIPVTHKQKIFKEKWYLSKSLADREQFDNSD